MNISRLLHTILYLKPKQIFYQVKYRLVKPAYVAVEAPAIEVPKLKTAPIAKYKCLEGEVFSFLNLEHQFAGWNFTDNGMLWAYNQNYFDWLNQEGITAEEGCKWIDLFNSQLSTLNSQLSTLNSQPSTLNSKLSTLNSQPSLAPYPIALRSINWIKFFCRFPENATKPRLDSLYSQVKLLEKKLEYHLLGNHLLEDAYALYIAASFFQDTKLLNKATKLLLSQLEEQTLPDGAHYEQSPMYHCILLDRLLDCINIAPNDELKAFATKQLGWLKSICFQDGTFPMFNDSALGIAPAPNDIVDYARRLGIESDATPLKESGYRKMSNAIMEAFVDVGNITASYQPGHSHADTFNFELRINGTPFIIDTGISTYEKNARRQYERGTAAHNCVAVDGNNSSEVYGGFRVGKRCVVTLISDNGNSIEAVHNGYGKPCKRSFFMSESAFMVEDRYDGDAISYLHLPNDIDLNHVKVDGATRIEIDNDMYSTGYNCFMPCRTMKMYFNGTIKFSIE